MRQVKLFNVLRSYGLDGIKDLKVKELSYFDKREEW